MSEKKEIIEVVKEEVEKMNEVVVDGFSNI